MLKKKARHLIFLLTVIISLIGAISPALAATGDPGKLEAESYAAMSGIQRKPAQKVV